MKTALYTRNGPAHSVLEMVSKPVPDPAVGEVSVKLSTSGVNPSDVKSRAGRPLAFDFQIPHSDGAGIIDRVGEGVDASRVGERVWIWNGAYQRPYGTAAEFIVVPEFQAVSLADDIDFRTAACFGIPGLTAAHAVNLVVARGHNKVLVTGAANAVGHYVTQMLVKAGIEVIATTSKSKESIALDVGASIVIDYHNEDVGERLAEITKGNGVDAVIDMDFSSTSRLIPSSGLASGSSIYCYGSNDMGDLEVPFRDLLFKSISLVFFLVYELPVEERLTAIKRLNEFMASGNAVTRISHALAFDEIATAHELVESGQANGNVVLEL